MAPADVDVAVDVLVDAVADASVEASGQPVVVSAADVVVAEVRVEAVAADSAVAWDALELGSTAMTRRPAGKPAGEDTCTS